MRKSALKRLFTRQNLRQGVRKKGSGSKSADLQKFSFIHFIQIYT
jgi:hypothetical protein